jgi:hypothetical protein
MIETPGDNVLSFYKSNILQTVQRLAAIIPETKYCDFRDGLYVLCFLIEDKLLVSEIA